MSNPSQRLILIIGSIAIIAAGAILILSAAPGGAPTANAPIATAPQNAAQPDAAPTEDALPNIVRVSLGNAKAAYDLKQATFVDVRDIGSYNNAHVKGALSIPLADLESRFKELDPNAWIITYCTWPQEESSARAAQILLDHGFKHVNPILGGFHAWVTAGYPTEP